jgi:phage tail tube protein FII
MTDYYDDHSGRDHSDHGKLKVFKYHDKDGDGYRDHSEHGLPGFKIWVDLDQDRYKDSGEVKTTGYDGKVTFDHLKIGKVYHVEELLTKEQVAKGWYQTDDDPGYVRLTYSGQHKEIDFGNAMEGELKVHKYHDKDGDGYHDRGEKGLEGFKIWLDRDGDHRKDDGEVRTTDHHGNVVFKDLEIGKSYHVEELLTKEQVARGWYQTDDDPGYVKLTYSGQHKEIDFGNDKKEEKGELKVHKYYDKDGDGYHDRGEKGLEGFKIWLDRNGDHRQDYGEVRATDYYGNAVFKDLEIGKNYHVEELLTKEQVAKGWYQTDDDPGYVTLHDKYEEIDFGNNRKDDYTGGHHDYIY